MGKVVYTGGTFDLFHAGHVNFLRQCKKFGKVVVSLNSDEFIESYKGAPPIMTYQERKTALLSCRYVDKVIKNIGGSDSRPAIRKVNPDFVVIGSDWAGKDYYSQMQFTQGWLDRRGIVLCYVPYTQGVSTTEVKRRMIERSKNGKKPRGTSRD